MSDEEAFTNWVVALPLEAAFLADGGSRGDVDYCKLYSEAWAGWLAGIANFRATAASACDELASHLKDESAVVAARICAATIRALGVTPAASESV